MSITRRDLKHMGLAVLGLVLVIVGVSALESGGLSWTGFLGALLVALYASAVVVAAIAFYSTYRRHNPPHARPPVYHAHQVGPPEGLEEPYEAPVPAEMPVPMEQPQPEERPTP